MCGVAPAHVRKLCDNTWEGGYGFTPAAVGEMTLDMIFMLLANKKNLRSGKHRSNVVEAHEALQFADKNGLIKGRDKQGNPIQGKVHGKSLAQRVADGEVAFDLEGNKIDPKKKKRRETRKERRIRQAAEQKRKEDLLKLIREHEQ